ncbi:MAG: ATP-binding protein [Deltaproteobacteria bacterium]|nr:MAG: ATP-binding protein [Deltaproteobacteria bacterium]
MVKITKRLLDVPDKGQKSYFLWGPRRVGKSYWIRNYFADPDDHIIDLLQTDVFAEYAARPSLLRERFDGRFVIIDEIQKLPALLDEVHWLIENCRARFLLCGSSARKLRRGHANLLAGRARRLEMGPLSFLETEGLSLDRVMVSGMLPEMFTSDDPVADLRAYVADYLAQEIAAEGAVRNLPAFSEFLRVAALTNAELLNYTNVAAEVGVSAKVVRGYFEILEDTMLGFRLRPWSRRKKRRLVRTEKFYLFDVGVANYLAGRRPQPGSFEFGKSFEHFILCELMNYKRYRMPELEITFWRTAGGVEVDFILGDMAAAIEVKASARVAESALRPFRALGQEYRPRRQLVVSLERQRRRVGEVEILPWRDFLHVLFAGELTG